MRNSLARPTARRDHASRSLPGTLSETEHFLWIKEKGSSTLIPYGIASAELDRLDKAKGK